MGGRDPTTVWRKIDPPMLRFRVGGRKRRSKPTASFFRPRRFRVFYLKKIFIFQHWKWPALETSTVPTVSARFRSPQSDPKRFRYAECAGVFVWCFGLSCDSLIGGSVAEWLALLRLSPLRRRRARVPIALATLSGNSLRQTVHTHCASVHQAAKLVAAILRVAGVTAGLAESNDSLPPGL